MLEADREQLSAAFLADLFDSMEDATDREAVSALLRNCLTHPEAARIMRDEVMCERARTVAETIGGEQAALRAALVGATTMRRSMARYARELPALAQVSREDIERLMLPALQALVGPPAAPGSVDAEG